MQTSELDECQLLWEDKKIKFRFVELDIKQFILDIFKHSKNLEKFPGNNSILCAQQSSRHAYTETFYTVHFMSQYWFCWLQNNAQDKGLGRMIEISMIFSEI